jgi:hypothetical protein
MTDQAVGTQTPVTLGPDAQKNPRPFRVRQHAGGYQHFILEAAARETVRWLAVLSLPEWTGRADLRQQELVKRRRDEPGLKWRFVRSTIEIDRETQ